MSENNRIEGMTPEVMDKILQVENDYDLLKGKIETLEKELDRSREREKMARKMIDQIGKHGYLFGAHANDDQLFAAIGSLLRLVEKGKHMEILEEANKNNPMAADAWKKFMLCLRISE